MKAYTVNQYKKNEKLALSEVPSPTVGEKQVLVEIYSSAINLLDSKIRDGEFKLILKYKPSFILGHDLAGVVRQVGSKVTKFKVGDEVFSRVRDYHQGTFAESIAVREDDLALKPKNISMNEAASVPLVGLTAWQALVEIGQLRPGQKVFIQAGSGGVGSIAIQLAKHLGAYVATTTSSKNFEFVKSLGADEVIDYKTQEFDKILSNYDLVLHSQDSQNLEKSVRIIRSGGKLVSISGPPDSRFAKKLGFPLTAVVWFLSRKVRKATALKNIQYSFLFMRADGHQLGKLAELIEGGIIKPIIDRKFSFRQIPEAMSYVESGRAVGKVVIDHKAD
ncbi:NADP-dependent oxidoreductase [Bdellovibrio sp. ZAP7]|uniref:NADP-dependent oxidoreductase n=1 Tax=Bdellovibrio sp. ZAP7 TaxID=2231053 RepID=UPI0011577826|nr:NADP-dependent oxidoreductase [Bdellovibrio sp. ZAP7]QDK47081.1 NADP-dependent oxidoreductase [Bdellovibrio sp. ZAP7]